MLSDETLGSLKVSNTSSYSSSICMLFSKKNENQSDFLFVTHDQKQVIMKLCGKSYISSNANPIYLGIVIKV